MRAVKWSLVVLVFFGVLALAGDSEAVIYKYLDAKGDPVYVDDLGKVPEPVRDKAVIVTGKDEQELTDDAERARAIAARQAAMEQQATAHPGGDSFLKRLLRSGIALGLVVAALFVMMHLDALREQADVVRKVRIALIAALVLFLGVTHAPDVMGLFRTVKDAAPTPVADIQERQAEKGRKAAEAYKNLDQAMQERVQSEADRIQKQVDEAERGR